MKNIAYAIMLSVLLSACAAASGVASLPSALLGGYKYFEGSEIGVAQAMRLTLAATQKALHHINMHVDILEHQDDGYAIVFGGRNIDGMMRIVQVTENLSTVQVSITKRMIHQTALEKTVLNTIDDQVAHIAQDQHFIFSGYVPLLQEAQRGAMRLAWYRRGAYVETKPSKQDGWVEVRLPSGHQSFLDLKVTTQHPRQK